MTAAEETTDSTDTPETTESVLAGMLKENTGTHMLDSGGAYGRHWQRNQVRDFEAEKPSNLEFSVYNSKPEIAVMHNVYHWLKERCHFEAELDALFHGEFLEEVDPDDDKHWLELMEEFPDWLAKYEDEDGDIVYGESTGFYGEGEPITINTHNEEELLSQILQFKYFCNVQGEFIALQIHGGADVRGGYTKPRIFSVGRRSELDIFEYNRASIYCTGEDHLPEAEALREAQEKQLTIEGIDVQDIDFDGHHEHNWYTDDGCHYYYQGSCGAGTQLEAYEVQDLSEEPEEGEEPPKWVPGILFIKDKVGYCPHCGARLAASF